jgi:hypothetical protein
VRLAATSAMTGGVAGRLAGWASAGLLALTLTGCGTGALPYPPTGVDELVIPTPAPKAGDFVGRIDNQWLPLAPGRTWVYDVRRIGHPDGVRTVSVLADPVTVAGVRTTAVQTVFQRQGEPRSTRTDYYAQDTRGNVWWFGREGLWRAGREGAEAGLVITAVPRLGDGYRAAYEKGVVEDVVTVAQAKPVVSLEWTTALAPGSAVWDTYRKGVGLVDRIDSGTGERDTLRQ